MSIVLSIDPMIDYTRHNGIPSISLGARELLGYIFTYDFYQTKSYKKMATESVDCMSASNA